MTPSRDTNPSAYQDVFVNELRARREASGLSRNKLAAALGCTPQWLAKVETFEKPPSEGLADDLDTYFQLGGTFRRVWEKHQEARKRGLIPSGFRPLIGAEKEADQVNIYEPLLIPGLFQTEDYARLVLSASRRLDKLEELIAIRLGRQAILDKADPPWIFLLIREAVIRDLHPEINLGQCKRLLDLADRPTISVQIVPTKAHLFHPAGFQILGFPRADSIAYMEGTGEHGQTLTNPEAVRKLAVLFNLARSEALSAEESMALVRAHMEGT
ncbi:helix-turn-helix domain-containing protein [Actinomadura madurae]|uniref:helix-turn-helix domain-containing protein n=1 Tax=Actinomadura madurae TaxID=1993 RepID=UPI00202610C2|nr:helix-turn-helix transcriptional regulator [Actinomadura madurae]URM99343.1 helix-turn-helix domain-containing protein [Actinomadura madurae]